MPTTDPHRATVRDAASHADDVLAVITARAVTPVFQPLVRLVDRRVVGFEALSRGPAGSRFESPAVLFAEAADRGVVGELDWLCRAKAYQAALDANLDSSISLYVNTEPAALHTPCPVDLRPVVHEARARLRVVTEMTERAIAGNPAGLLAAADTCRNAGWRVALDDVGADPASLALMPFIQPDVVKLDMGLVQHPDAPQTARIVNAVLAYAEASGAHILAEGIETEQHLANALAMGADLGQGWLFGRPGPLPANPRPGIQLHPPFTTAPVEADTRSPYEIVAAHRTPVIATKAQLMPMSRYLEAQATHGEHPPVLLACFQHARHYTSATARRFERLAGTSAFVAAFGAGLPADPGPGIRGAHLAPHDPLRDEWNVVVIGPHFAAALVAKDLGDRGPEPERRFSYAVTYRRDLAIQAARTLLHRITPSGHIT